MESFVLSPGSILKDRYCVQRIIDQDGSVVEYLAQDCANGARYRVRQVHVVYTDPNTSRKHRQAFRETAPQLIGLHHRALTAVVDCFDQGPDFFTVSAWVDGPSLATTAVPVSTETAMRWMMDVLDAMDVVGPHADRIGLPELSPQTVRVRDNGSIVIGSLRCLDDGTPARIQPSPFHGGEVERSFKGDMYTLGALTWWLLTGQPPPTVAERKRADRGLTNPPGMPVALGKGLLRMMSLDARRRPSSTAQVRQFFVQSGAAPTARRARPRAIQWPLVAGAAVSVGLLLLTPLVQDGMLHIRSAHHARSLAALVDGARLDVKHASWRAAAADFTRAQAAGATLTPADILDQADAERRSWRPERAREVLETTSAGLAGSRWWLEMARIDSDEGRPADEALSQATSTLDQAPGGAVQLLAGELALLQHQSRTAELAFRQAISDRQCAVQARVLLGDVLRRDGDYAAATEELQRARDMDPDAVAATVALGRVQLDSGLFSQAILTFSDALHHAPGCDEAWFRMGQAALAAGQREDALGAFFQAVRRNSQNGEELAALGHTLALTDRLTYASQVWDLARTSLDVVRSHPAALAQVELDEGQAEAAVQTLADASTDDPCTLYLQAEAAVEAHQEATVDQTVNRLEHQPDGSELGSFDVGRIDMQLGRLADAHTALAAALQQRPDEPAYLLAMGQCLVRAGEYSKGTRYLARATMDRPTCSDALRSLAQAEAHLRQYELSANHLQKLCELDDRVQSWQAAGQRWGDAHRWDKAIRCYLIGERHHPGELRFKYWLANCFAALGKVRYAAFDYKTFLRDAPGDPLADQAQMRLQRVRQQWSELAHHHHHTKA